MGKGSGASRAGKARQRLDVLLVERGLVSSRHRAQGLILAGHVLVDDVPITKAGTNVSLDSAIRLRQPDHPYVSRGALKLIRALDEFGIDVRGRVAMDIGASTGGFTHVLLKRGIEHVFAIDVGRNQLDWRIRSDPRVDSREGVNARHLQFEDVGQTVDLLVMDVSFISLKKILPALLPFATQETDWITLIKPQFEVGPERVGKGGIVEKEDDRQSAVNEVTAFAEGIGLNRLRLVESPIKGTDGNTEFLAHWRLTS